MADLFDIANLITTVGVDAVKIKPEPGLPEKSSNEILTELFSTFDVDEGIVSPQNDSDTNTKGDKSEKKKKKKKHKHKDKKHKKKSKRNSSDSSDSEGVGTKKKKKHKKKSKRKLEDGYKSSDSGSTKCKLRKLNDELIATINPKTIEDEFNILGREDSKYNDVVVKKEPNEKDETISKNKKINEFSPLLPPVSQKIDDTEEPVPLLLEKAKTSSHGKILIKDLKNSVVYNETVKEIENKEKEKAARMEDGEISDSSDDDDDRTPTLSPSPTPDFKSKSPILNNSLEKSKEKSKSPTSRKKIKNDLRLILKEKERKRKERKTKDDKDGKSHRNYKDSKKDNNKQRTNSQGKDKKRSTSQQRSHRSRSRDKDKHRGRSRERRERRWSHDRWEGDRSRDRRHYSRHRSRSRERKERIEIDKKKLLEIARKNAIGMIKRGALPLAQRDKAIAAIQAGGKTVEELTDFCKSLSKSEALGELSSISSDDGSESEKGFHHPFLLKERPNSIIMNIRDAKQLPTKTFQEKTAESSNQLRLQFPVSSGQLHRKTESEWVPVPPKKVEPQKKFVPASEPLCSLPKPVPVPAPVPPPAPVAASVPTSVPTTVSQPSVFPQNMSAENIDIGSIVSQRLAAMRKLRENPNDVCALNEMYRAQNEMKSWAESKQMPGHFTGSTGVKVLTPAELTSGYQAWARKANRYIRKDTSAAA
ncbi:protein Son isoform X2 [Leptopilina boulardi]|uniref:protein Son isoform X2 n=1 Tax=Leptopilina boulardi TaxID=63433 RepID=UPI0021F558F9|nr:protein Son isoform X2 [Leptopilina boulardi]